MPHDGDARSFEDVHSFEALHGAVLAHARSSCGADGATFVLREGDNCFYVAEDAIGPLWAGQRFPLTDCISGWTMLRGEVAHVPEPYRDDRIPHAAYRPTFVQSLVAVPMGRPAVGAICVYWARPGRLVDDEELAALTELAADAAARIEGLGLASAPWAPNFALDRSSPAPVG